MAGRLNKKIENPNCREAMHYVLRIINGVRVGSLDRRELHKCQKIIKSWLGASEEGSPLWEEIE